MYSLHLFVVYPCCVFSVKRYRCFSRENVSSSRLFEFTFNTNSTGGKSLTTRSYSISHFMSRPHIITANLSRHRLTTRAFKAQSKMHICFWSNISAPLSCCSGIIGITVCRKQSEAPDRSMTSQTLFFCLVNPTAPSEEIQLNLSFKEYVTAGA